jgi:hypothetical protein
MAMNAQTEIIRELNNQLRRDFRFGSVFMTPGISSLGPDMVEQIIKRVAAFDDFNDDNDPYGEADLGQFEIGGRTVLWKIDYYDVGMEFHSPDPADPKVTQRVLTIMLAEEY